MDTNIKSLLEQVQSKAEEKQAELADIRGKIEKQKEALAEAEAQAAAAYANVDAKGYHAAQDQQREAKDTIEMLEKRLQAACIAPRLSKEEYKALEDEIRKAYAEALEDVYRKAADHLSAIAAMRPELEETWRAGQDALTILQEEVMHDEPCVTNQNGNKVRLFFLEKHLPEITLLEDIEPMACDIFNNVPPLKRFGFEQAEEGV